MCDNRDHGEYINQRWKQLYELDMEWCKEAIKWLMLINSGGAVASLGFIGSFFKDKSHPSLASVFCLGFFLLGLVLGLVLIIYFYEQVSKLFRDYSSDIKKGLSFNELCKNDDSRIPSGKLGRVFGYLSLVFMCLGGISGLIAIWP